MAAGLGGLAGRPAGRASWHVEAVRAFGRHTPSSHCAMAPSRPYSDDDVVLLAQLSSLTSLRLGRQEFVTEDAHPAGPLAALQAALPDCQIDA